MSPASAVLAIDVGGTFTDVVLTGGGPDAHLAKVLTTADDPTEGVAAGVRQVLAESELEGSAIGRVVHATTLATNLILERRGARVVTATTAGFADLLRLGRPARVESDRFNLHVTAPESPLSATDIVEVDERILADGTALRDLDPREADLVAERVAALRPEAVAICLLHSWANPLHERRLADAIVRRIPGTFVSRSSDVWPELREHDRAMTTALSAYVGPPVAGYLERLTRRLADAGIHGEIAIMDSAGGVVDPAVAVRRPVSIVESGGAAGLRAAAAIATAHTKGHALSFDMGGTTAKVGVVRDGEPGVTHQFQVGGTGSYGFARPGTGFPVKGPVADLAEIGAGGGSIARVDSAGSLRVGPRSAGSAPGPASYCRGGVEPTVTDANVVLGILPDGPLASGVTISRDAACAAVDEAVAQPLGLDVVDAAIAIREIAIAQMAAAIRIVTTQRGVDPRAFPIIAFGGAAPMHAVALADTFGIDRVIVPWGAGLGSAFGLVAAPVSAARVRTRPTPLDDVHGDAALAELGELVAEAADEIGVDTGAAVVTASVDVRYVGQAHELSVPAGDLDDRDWVHNLEQRFRDLYAQSYGVALDAPSEMVNLRVRLSVGHGAVVWRERHIDLTPKPTGTTSVHLGRAAGWQSVDTWDWSTLPAGRQIAGPALITGGGSTVLVEPGWTLDVGAPGHLELRRHGPPTPSDTPLSGDHSHLGEP